MRLASAALAVAVALSAARAGASEIFPPQIQKDLGLKQVPDCILCHETEKGEKNTVTRPFGISMRQAGLSAGNLGSLSAALKKLDAQHTDSDGDGEPDIDELKEGRNPNLREVVVVSDAGAAGDAAPVIIELPPPPGPPLLETGCEMAFGSRFAHESSRPVLLLSGALAVAFARYRRRPNRGGGLT